MRVFADLVVAIIVRIIAKTTFISNMQVIRVIICETRCMSTHNWMIPWQVLLEVIKAKRYVCPTRRNA